jgi:hypothetical protein
LTSFFQAASRLSFLPYHRCAVNDIDFYNPPSGYVISSVTLDEASPRLSRAFCV